MRVSRTLEFSILLRHIYMTEKSFLEILSEKIENRVRNDFSREQTSVNQQSNNKTASEKSTQNVDNSRGETKDSTVNDTVYNQWMNQIPLEKIHFSTPKQQVFGRIYPINTPRPKPLKESNPTQKSQPQPPRQKHMLNERQMQAVVYFWGFQIKLAEDFTSQELKKAFRSLALRLHPDRSLNDASHDAVKKTKAFIEMKAHYQCLLSVFNTKS